MGDKTESILIVDDNDMTRELIKCYLEDYNYIIAETDSGITAIKLISIQKFDIILLDILLDINGLDVLEEIRKKFSITELPVIMITGKLESEDIVKALELGANDYITKPIDFMVLLARLKTHLLLKRKEEELKESNERALSASRAKSDFLSRMSHEIRTPMNAVMGMSDLLAETNLDDTQKKYVNTIQRAGNNLLNVINDILDLSKIEAGQMHMENVAFDLNDVVQNVLDIMSIRAQGKKLELNLEMNSDVPNCLAGDPNRLKQILINLIGNSIKFTPTGQIVLKIENNPEPGEYGDILFSVSDTGIGIAADKLNDIFEDFIQADLSITSKYGGTGLGLSIVRKLIQIQGGSLSVRSKEGEGSVFTFNIKFDTLKVQNKSCKEEIIPTHATISDRIIKILLVDDSEDNQDLIKEYLKNGKYQIDTADNGEMAVEKVKNQDFDIVLMDIQMPVMDGYTATQNIRKWEKSEGKKEIPIIALTAYAIKEETQKSIDAGCNTHITKPVKKQVLIDTIMQNMDQ